MTKFLPLLTLALCFAGLTAPAQAQQLFGTPMVQESGVLMIDGQQVTIWGIEALASDQQCWHGESAWSCGEQALLALKHFAAGQLVKCDVKPTQDTGRLYGKCAVQKPGKPEDIGHYLVVHGWALDEPVSSNRYYSAEQDTARLNRRGIWTSRFQTAADWRAGMDRYVDYDMAPEPQVIPTVAVVQPEPIIINEIVVPLPIAARDEKFLNGKHDHEAKRQESYETHEYQPAVAGVPPSNMAPPPAQIPPSQIEQQLQEQKKPETAAAPPSPTPLDKLPAATATTSALPTLAH